MVETFWQQVAANGHAVPDDRPIGELTTELARMLGSTDPHAREETALRTLLTWVDRGVYDDLLTGLGDGMATGLATGLGEDGEDSVFRRACSVAVLGRCVARDREAGLLPPGKVLEWGDRVATWWVRERDLRGYVDGKGWAHAAGRGADAIAELALSPAFDSPELTVLLDVMADRLLLPTTHRLTSGEPDRMARATTTILSRDLVPLTVLEPWVARIQQGATGVESPTSDPWTRTFNARAFLRALHLRLAVGHERPAVRSDLLLVVTDAVRATLDLD
jgi:hypothetical protein